MTETRISYPFEGGREGRKETAAGKICDVDMRQTPSLEIWRRELDFLVWHHKDKGYRIRQARNFIAMKDEAWQKMTEYQEEIDSALTEGKESVWVLDRFHNQKLFVTGHSDDGFSVQILEWPVRAIDPLQPVSFTPEQWLIFKQHMNDKQLQLAIDTAFRCIKKHLQDILYRNYKFLTSHTASAAAISMKYLPLLEKHYAEALERFDCIELAEEMQLELETADNLHAKINLIMVVERVFEGLLRRRSLFFIYDNRDYDMF